MKDIQILDPSNLKDRELWDESVRSFPGGTVFHTTAWMDIVRKGLGLPPRFAYIEGKNRTIRALVPLFRAGGLFRALRWINVPQGCPSDPLAKNPSDAEALLNGIAAAASEEGARAVVLRTNREFQTNLPHNWKARREAPLLRHVLNLVQIKDIFGLPMARYNHLQNFRTLRRTLPQRGMAIRRLDADQSEVFAGACHRILLRNHGHVGYPVRFFEAISWYLPEASRFLLVGPSNGPSNAFVFCIWSPPTCYLIHQGGLPTKDGREAARWALGEEIAAVIAAGLDCFDMGETPPENRGLRFFKEGWGAEAVDGSYLIMAPNEVESGLRVMGSDFKTIAPLMRRLPVNISLRVAGMVHRSLQ